MWRIRYALQVLKDDRGIGVVEVILILVVLIGLVIIFKSQLTSLVRQYSKRLPAKVPEFKCGEHRKEEDDDRVCKRRGNGISDTDIYSACLACTCVDGKRIHPDGKELQKGRYEPGSGVRICGISKRTSGTL